MTHRTLPPAQFWSRFGRYIGKFGTQLRVFFLQEQTELTEQTKLAQSFQPDDTFKATGPCEHNRQNRDGRAVIAKRPSIIGNYKNYLENI